MNYVTARRQRRFAAARLNSRAVISGKAAVCMKCYAPFPRRPVMNSGFINWNIIALPMARELM